MSFPDELERIREPIWTKVKEYLPAIKDQSGHHEMIWEYPKRMGKYFRPALVILSAEMHGSTLEEALLTATAVQISEEWILIHDDFEDHSEERRSTKTEYRPSLNKMHGDELAVNAGDALHVIMWQVLGGNARNLVDGRGWKIYDRMVHTLLTTIEGQHMELSWTGSNRIDISEREYFDMIYRKTARYSIINPLQLGAIVAGNVSDNSLTQIERWGKPFGYAFQIWDDVINLTSDSNTQGKEKGGDILEGKRTLVLKHLLDHCTAKEKLEIEGIYQKPRNLKSGSEKDYILKLFDKYGSISYAQVKAKEAAGEAQANFKRYADTWPKSKAKTAIAEGIEFVVNRTR